MKSLKKQLDRYMEEHREEMIEDILRLCRIKSVKASFFNGKPFGEGTASALLSALRIADGYGFQIHNHRYYVGTVDFNEEEKQLDILAHLDVVPAGDGWTVTEPFEPVVRDGKIYGRGTSDDKGPAMAALYAMRAIKDLGIPLKKNVRLILGTDEECGGQDIAYYYSEEKEAPMTFSPDAEFPVINIEKGRLDGRFHSEFEPSKELPRLVSLKAGEKLNVVPGKARAVVEGLDDDLVREIAASVTKATGVAFSLKGRNNALEILASGETAHASAPEKGKNALTALLQLVCRLPMAPCRQMNCVQNLEKLFPYADTRGEKLGVAMSDEKSGELTVCFSVLEIEEDNLEGAFDARLPLCATEENVLNPVKIRFAENSIVLENDSIIAPHEVPEDSEFIGVLLRAYEMYTGEKGKCLAEGGMTYAHNLKNGVAFGACMPGTDTRMHGPDEFVVIDELVTSAKIYAQVIADLCS